MSSKESLPTAHETLLTTAPKAKDMMRRLWTVAELLAEAAKQEMNTNRSNQASAKTQH
jgi:ribosomal protein L17